MDEFIARHGRRPRLLVLSHQRQLASQLAGHGCDVDIAASDDRQHLIRQALDNDVHAIICDEVIVEYTTYNISDVATILHQLWTLGDE